ncbi:SDR family oxidoreductase [Pleomorphomonas oryzae]|uniref:SDR family oxidoreductase n=1 Tax=Pleomorphomonas oryzae TaxID=261934 RepID=UPI00040D0D65|nr:SDR family oxidoreductase [Pleomorphomonas oryzae]
MERHDGKRVVITGGTSGIGLATAKLLISQGARVLITGRTEATLETAREQLGNNAIAVESDAASLADIDRLADRVKSEFGTIDLLYVNAGITRFMPFEAMTEAVYDEVLTVNAKGPYFTVQKLAPLIAEGGAVVVTTSVVNEMGYPMISAYSASKAALRSMVRSLARELLPRGIRVNAVSPGPIETGILDKTLPSDVAAQTKQAMTENNPMKRFGRPEEIAKTVAFLAFDATFTTGAELAVDGGGSQL